MKTIDIFCASQASTSISTPMDSTSSGRAIDRHNPIIQDQKRLAPSRKNNDQKRKTIAFADENNDRESLQNKNNHNKNITTGNVVRRQGGVLLGWGCTRPGDFISPATSSRFLLSDKTLSDQFDPLLKTVPAVAAAAAEKLLTFDDDKCLKKKDDGYLPSSRFSDGHQVVVLRVSLHCKGCEKKMRKHISKMEGVTSFNIDFMAKKVTVVGDVTPLAVLTSVSKVKNAKLLTPTTITSSSVPPADSEIKKQLT